MTSRAHFVQLDPNEDANSVRDRLSFIKGKRVLLVWPESGTVLNRRLDLVLVQREAMRRAIQLAFVTHDPQVVQYAQELNISTFETIGESERKRWKRGRSKVFTQRHQKPDGEPNHQELLPVASRVRNPNEPNAVQTTLSRLFVFALLLVVMLGLGYVLIPSADVTLFPARSEEQVSVTISASANATDIDIESRIIPMTRLRVETVQSGTIETSGSVALSDTRAVGTVVFINRTAGRIEIPVGTVIATSAGTPIQFRTLEQGTLPGGVGLQAEVPIEALQDFAGEIGNVDVGLINTIVGDLAAVLEVRNVQPTVGGVSQTVSAVSRADLERLEATVRQQIQAQAFNEMQPLLSESQFIILETIAITDERNDWKTFSADVGEISDTLTLTMRAIVEAAAVDEQFGRQIAFANLSSLVPRGRRILPETVRYVRGAVSEVNPDGIIRFDMTVNATVIEPLDPNQLRQALANRTPSDALSYIVNEIDLQDGTLPEIRLAPAWARRMPLLPLRIRVVLQEEPSPS